jgi:hypothetical protein
MAKITYHMFVCLYLMSPDMVYDGLPDLFPFKQGVESISEFLAPIGQIL